jgi:hypothetical protein
VRALSGDERALPTSIRSLTRTKTWGGSVKSFGLSLAFGVAFVVACIVAAVAIGEVGAYLMFGAPALIVSVILVLSVAGWRRSSRGGDA